jgi:hypothetical protein
MALLQGNVHVDRLLTDFAVNYRPQGFIGDQIFPVVNVPKQSDIYATYNQADLFRVDDTRRAPGTEANIVRYRVGSANFFCRNYALKAQVTQEERANADPIFQMDIEQGRVAHTMDKLLLDRDIRVASLAFNTNAVGSSAAVGSSWSDGITGHSNPLGDYFTARDNVENATGYRPNLVVFGLGPWKAFRQHQDVVTKATNPNYLAGGNYPSIQQVAQLLEVDKVLVGQAQFNTAHAYLTQSLSRIWGNSTLVAYVTPTPRIDAPTLGAQFQWAGAPVPPWAARRFPFDDRKGVDEIQIDYYMDEQVVASAFGFLLTSCSSAGF